ncbi:putative folate receptor gamma [Apostichopus japonicus]|uniref:Putative folate receptor gamma n=1 Tax=Stichopus japonicus TaxID=307972 RepID=A0A2G8KPA3_STIJA|nr:putative folate receptor gamma [Apostichopus japonicus]
MALLVKLSLTVFLVLSHLASISSHGTHSTHYTIDSNVNETALDKYLNRCMAGISHKDFPGPEPNLHDQCAPWADRACCDPVTTFQFHTHETWYNFDWNHCEKELSASCQRWMVQDLCFYECSPNVAPWLVEHRISIRDERFVGVPLCKSECDLWFSACKNDYTCKDDWSKGWNWTTGTNKCPEGSQCSTFQDTFETAENFCQNLWGGSFEVVDDEEQCMFLWFSGDVNPNDEVAQRKALELLETGGQSRIESWTCLVLSIATVFLSLFIS